MSRNCFNCSRKGKELYGFTVCDACKNELRLFKDETINRHIKKYTKPEYKKNVQQKLTKLESEYVKKKIKLLDILTKINM